MNLHIIQDSPYVNHFIEVSNQLKISNNEFIILQSPPYRFLNKKLAYEFQTIKEISSLNYVKKYKNIYFHGFGGDRFTFAWKNYFRLKYLKLIHKKPKLIWLYFGFEFYGVIKQDMSIDLKSNKTFLEKINFKNYNLKIFLQRKLIFKEIDYIGHYIPKEIDLIKNIFNIKAKQLSFFYGANYINNTIEINKKINTIIFGNSATLSNNHLEGAQNIQELKDLKKLIVPLSYGSKKYSQFISEQLNQIFGDRFQPLSDFLDYDEYFKMLIFTDAGVFNYYRSQGMGNIIQLIILHKPIFLNRKNPAFNFLTSIGIKIGDITKIEEDFIKFNEKVLIKNSKNIKTFFSEQNCKINYRKILSI